MRWLWLLAMLALPAQAQRVGEVGFTVDQWGGLDTINDSSRISDFDATTSENILTDAGGLSKRTGNVRLTSILTGYPNKALREFVPASLTRYVIAHADNSVYSTDLSGTVVQLTTVTADARVDMVQALNKLIIQDGQMTPIQWDATSTSTLSGMPICKYAEYANERIYCGNIPSQSASRVAVSSYGGVSYFTVPANVSEVAEAPNTFDFQREDGDVITCLKATRCGVFVGKSRSTHIIKGYDNFTFRKDVISENIGCQDDRSVQTIDGNIVWLGQDAVYAWSCAGKPVPISREIDSDIKSLRQGSSFSASWVLNTQGDFEAGNLTASGAGAPMSSTLESGSVVASTMANVDTSSSDFAGGTLTDVSISSPVGSVVLSSNVVQDDFSDGDYSSNLAWTVLSGGFSASANRLTATGAGLDRIETSVSLASASWSFNHYYTDSTGDSPGRCAGSADDGSYYTCFLFKFLKNAGGDYYAIRLHNPNGTYDKTFQLIKNISSVETVLSETSITSGYLYNSNNPWSIVLSTGVGISVYNEGVFIASSTSVGVSSASKIEFGLDYYTSGRIIANSIDDLYIYQYKQNGSIVSRIFDTSFSTPIYGALSSTFTAYNAQGEGNIAFYVQVSSANDGGGFGTLVTSSDTLVSAIGQKQYFRYKADFSTLVSTKSPRLDSISLAAATSGYYYSPIKFVGTGLSAYGAFDTLETIPSGAAITYSVRAGTYSFPAGTESISWSTAANHATVGLAVSTPTYFQYRALLVPSTGDQLVKLERSQLTWTEGTVSPPVASGWKDGRYFLCATVSATATYPDTCFVYQRNKKWTTFTGFSAASMAPYNRDLIIGDGSTSGYVWKILQDSVYNDDGAAIAATWISKDFMFGPNGRDWAVGPKVLNEVWIDAQTSSSTYLTVGYAINKSTTYVTSILDLGAWGDTVNRLIPFSTTGFAKYFNIKLYNADLDKGLRLNGYSIYGEPQSKTQD